MGAGFHDEPADAALLHFPDFLSELLFLLPVLPEQRVKRILRLSHVLSLSLRGTPAAVNLPLDSIIISYSGESQLFLPFSAKSGGLTDSFAKIPVGCYNGHTKSNAHPENRRATQ